MAREEREKSPAPSTDEDEAILKREGNRVNGVEQVPSGVRPALGRDEDDADAGGTGGSY